MITVQKLNVVKEIDERYWPDFEKNGYVRVEATTEPARAPRKTAVKETDEE